MNKNYLSRLAVFSLLTLSFASTYASEEMQNSDQDLRGGSVSGEMNTILGGEYTNNLYRNPFRIKVKLYDSGDIQIDKIQFSVGKYIKAIEYGGYEINMDFLGMYREELHRNIGAEIGTRYIDLRVRKVFKVDAIDDFTYILEGYGTIDHISSLRASKDNQFINEATPGSTEKEERRFRRGGYTSNYGASLTGKYETRNGEFSAKIYAKNRSKRDMRNTNEQQYDFSSSEKGIKFTFKPNRNKCHKYSVGVKQTDYNQAFNGMNQNINDSEIYAGYECNFDLEAFLFPTNTGEDGDFIRY